MRFFSIVFAPLMLVARLYDLVDKTVSAAEFKVSSWLESQEDLEPSIHRRWKEAEEIKALESKELKLKLRTRVLLAEENYKRVHARVRPKKKKTTTTSSRSSPTVVQSQDDQSWVNDGFGTID